MLISHISVCADPFPYDIYDALYHVDSNNLDLAFIPLFLKFADAAL